MSLLFARPARGPFRQNNFQMPLKLPVGSSSPRATGKGVADPGGVPGALRWDVPGTCRGKQGTWELVIKDDEILHFNFVGK
jgi:hypothetical protein